ncbi:MAG TPA: hypothetical protein VLD63_10845 [Anaerolineales bacterium]|nr:hypothetical protein [Anaerolineales bacterium]
MITFRETLDGMDRLSELLRSAPDLESAVGQALHGLADLRSMLDSPRVRQAKTPDELRDYIDRVVLPQLAGVRDALDIGTKDRFKKMRTAGEQVERMIVRLRMLVDGSVDGLLG